KDTAPDVRGGGDTPQAGAASEFNRNPFGWVILVGLAMMLVRLLQSFGQSVRGVTWRQFASCYHERVLTDSRREERAVAARKVTAPGGADAAPETIRYNIPTGVKETVFKDLQALTNGAFRTVSGPGFWVQFLYWPFLWTVLLFVFIWFLLLRGL